MILWTENSRKPKDDISGGRPPSSAGLLISLGLELLARQVFGETDVSMLLSALSLGFWGFVLSTTSLLLLVIRWLILLAKGWSGPGNYGPRDLSRAEQLSYREPLSTDPSDHFSKAGSCRT